MTDHHMLGEAGLKDCRSVGWADELRCRETAMGDAPEAATVRCSGSFPPETRKKAQSRVWQALTGAVLIE